MNATDFISQFFRALDAVPYPRDPSKDNQWTEFIGKVMDAVADSFDCRLARRRPVSAGPGESGEHLGIDHVFFPLRDAKRLNLNSYGGDPLALPSAVVESENGYDIDRISYCLWKTTCLRAPLKVLICYQKDAKKVEQLREHLEYVLQKGHLADKESGEVLVIIGDSSLPETITWKDYFGTFVWKGDSLKKLHGVIRAP
jgi:hypothetical protein